MAKKMKVVVRRKDEDEQPPGACMLPFAGTPKNADRRKRSTTPQRKRAVATSSTTSNDPLAKAASGEGATDYSAWEALHDEESPARQPRVKKSSKPKSSSSADNAANFSVGGESSTQPLSHSTTSQRSPAPSPNRSVENLLTLPTPTDRSNRRRLQYENEKRQRGIYEGELEPVGTRGQEASVKKMGRLESSASQQSPAVNSNDEPQIRSFDRQPPAKEPKNFAGKQIALVPAPTSKAQSPQVKLENTAKPAAGTNRSTSNLYGKASTSQSPMAHQTRGRQVGKAAQPSAKTRTDDSSSESSSQKEMLPPLQLHTGTGEVMRGRVVLDTNSYVPAAYLPRGNAETDDDDESTKSDEELRRMQPDLMPTFSTDSETNKPAVVVSSSPRVTGTRMSPAAAAAARAAAATLVRDSEPPEHVDQLNKHAMVAVQEGRLNDAVNLFGKVLSIQKSRHGEKHPTVASAYHNLGTVQAKRAAALSEDAVAQQLCRTAALEAFQAAARTARDSLGSTHPNVAVSLVRIGFLLLHSKQYSNALITFAEALRIRLAAFGRNHALTANLYNNLGVCHMHLEEFEQGRGALHTGMRIQRQLCAQSDMKAKSNGTVPWLELADTLFNIGGLCMEWMRKKGPDLRRAQESEDAFAEAYQIRVRILGHDDPSTRQVVKLLAMARDVPRPRPRSSSPGPRRWRSEEAVALYIPPLLQQPSSPRSEQGLISPITGASESPAIPLVRSRSAPTTPESRYRNQFVYSTPDRSRGGKDEIAIPVLDQQRHVQAYEIFRTRSTGSGRRHRKPSATPPVLEVSFSQDSESNTGSAGSIEKQGKGTTRIYMSSQLVPGALTQAVNKKDLYNGLRNASFDEDQNHTSTSLLAENHTHTRLLRSFDYDNEENCLLSDSGVDSEHGRVHFPSAWNKAGLSTISEAPASNTRDIVVTRPFRAPSPSSEKWGSDTNNIGGSEETFSTGNKERDEIMSRAKAILASHDQVEDMLHSKVNDSLTVEPSQSIDPIDEEFDLPRGKKFNEDLLMEDGIAPLGGEWVASSQSWDKKIMLASPMQYLPNIHDQACKELNADNFVDAVHLYDVVLLCQKRRNGMLNAHVASALYNLGIAQLRSQNHGEALRAFEETARIRKKILGKEHPEVSVSLVKVGITMLLLHRFEEALWSFREALSVRKHALGAMHPSTARIYNNIGCVHVEFNEFTEATQAFESALEIQRNALCNEPESGPLMFGTATTLCNLGYLFRYKNLHGKAAVVLREAVDLQETVLGRTHPTVLSTLDNLADSCGSNGQAADALRHYNTILTRFRVGGHSGSQKLLRAEAVLLYKMSRVHRHRNDTESQLDSLKLALRAVRALSDPAVGGAKTDALERRIQYDIRSCRERISREDMHWI